MISNLDDYNTLCNDGVVSPSLLFPHLRQPSVVLQPVGAVNQGWRGNVRAHTPWSATSSSGGSHPANRSWRFNHTWRSGIAPIQGKRGVWTEYPQKVVWGMDRSHMKWRGMERKWWPQKERGRGKEGKAPIQERDGPSSGFVQTVGRLLQPIVSTPLSHNVQCYSHSTS